MARRSLTAAPARTLAGPLLALAVSWSGAGADEVPARLPEARPGGETAGPATVTGLPAANPRTATPEAAPDEAVEAPPIRQLGASDAFAGVPGRFLVELEPGTDPADLARAWAILSPRFGSGASAGGLILVQIEGDWPADAVAALLSATRGVVRAVPDRLDTLGGTGTGAASGPLPAGDLGEQPAPPPSGSAGSD